MNSDTHPESLLCQRLDTFTTFKKMHYPKGSNIFVMGSPVFGLYLLNAGKIKLSRIENDGKEIIIKIIGDSGIFGHRCFFSREDYALTATVIEDAQVTFIEKPALYTLLDQEPELSRLFLQFLSQEIEAADQRVSCIIRKKANERMADFLLSLIDQYGSNEEESITLNIHLTRSEMGAIVGLSAETVTRLMTEFKDHGILSEEGSHIIIQIPQKLRELSELS